LFVCLFVRCLYAPSPRMTSRQRLSAPSASPSRESVSRLRRPESCWTVVSSADCKEDQDRARDGRHLSLCLFWQVTLTFWRADATREHHANHRDRSTTDRQTDRQTRVLRAVSLPLHIFCYIVRFEIYTAVTMKNGVSWNVTP
jgi:hypothetical protein